MIDFDAIPPLDEDRVALAVVALVLCSFGLVANTLVVLTVYRAKLRDTHTILVGACAVYDVLLSLPGVVRFPFFLAANGWVGGNATCLVTAGNIQLWAVGQPLLLALLPLDRILAFKNQPLDAARALRLAWGVALVSLLVAGYTLLSADLLVIDSHLSCIGDPKAPTGVLLEVLLPAVLLWLLLAYGYLYRIVGQRFELLVDQDVRRTAEVLLFKKSLFLIVVFLMSWTPGYLVVFVSGDWPEDLVLLALVFTYLHVIITPVAYAFLNRRIRREVQRQMTMKDVRDIHEGLY